jgi:hypothetical protein
VIAPDDPRHGTVRGHNASCRCDPCDLAKYRYDKQRKAELHATGERRVVDSYRVKRRIEALQALGWPLRRIAVEAGVTHNHLTEHGRRKFAFRATFDAIDQAYQRLSMTLPPETTTGEKSGAARARNNARRKGYAPPLAWDDIDTDVEPNATPQNPDWEHDIDEAMVLRVVNEGGRRPRRLTNAEARECVRILIDRGHNSTVINEVYGLQANRYFQIERGAA